MSMLKTIKKKITRLETELAQLRAAEAAFGGKPTKTTKPAKAKAKTRAKAATKARARKPAGSRAPTVSRRAMTPEVLGKVLAAIGDGLPAIQLRAALGRSMANINHRHAVGKLKALGCIEVEGVKRNAVWKPTGLSLSAALEAQAAKRTAKADAVVEAAAEPTVETVAQA